MKRQSTAPRSGPHQPIDSAVKDIVFDMEAELRNLHGLVALLRVLSEAQDSIEPITLSVLANSGRRTYESLSSAWQAAFERTRND